MKTFKQIRALSEQRVDKHETSGYVIIDGHVFSDHSKGRYGYARYRTKDPDYVKSANEIGRHRRKSGTLDFDTLAHAKKWVKSQPKKSAEDIDRIHKKYSDFEKEMNE